MTIEMSGQIDSKELDFIPAVTVAEVPSSIKGGSKVEIEAIDPNLMDLEQAINFFARKHGITNKDFAPSDQDVVKNASRVELIAYEPKDSMLDATFEAAAKVETALQNTERPSTKTVEFAKGVEENFVGLGGCVDGGMELSPKEKATLKEIGLYMGPAEGAFKQQKKEINNKFLGKTAKNAATVGLVFQMFVGTGCTPRNIAITPENNQLPTPVVEIVTSVPATENAPAGSVETSEPTEAVSRSGISVEDTKNLPQSPEISVDSSGKLTGLPEDLTESTKEDMKAYYDAILKRFPGSTIYYSRDETEGTNGDWIFYPVTPEGKLIHWVLPYGESTTNQYADYPVHYGLVNGEWTVIDDYTETDIPGGVANTIWKSHLPQFLGGSTTFGTDTYFSDFLNNLTYEANNPWTKVAGIENLVAPTPEFTTLESLGDIYTNLSTDRISELETTLKYSVGTWIESKRYDSRDNTWNIKFSSSGELLDFQDSPLLIPVSETENIQVLVATKGYYLDGNSKAQEIIIPLAAQMPDGQMYMYGGSGYFEQWQKGDDIASYVKEKDAYYLRSGGHIEVSILTNAAISKNNFDTLKPDFDYTNYTHLYMVQWIRKYNLLNESRLQAFLETGNKLQFIIPYQMRTSP